MGGAKVAVVGGGLAGLMTAIKVCEADAANQVLLFSVVPVKRSHSVCAQGGINASKNLKGEGDSPEIHFQETVYGGDFLANQPPAKGMCYAAPEIVDLLDRMGVPFNRTPEGNMDFRRFGGTLYNRTAFAGATTGQQLMYALDEQVRRYEVEGQVKKYEYWEFLSIVLDDEKRCRGMVAVNLFDAKIEAFPADAVVICTGGPGLIFGRTTNSATNTGAAASRCYQQGATYANGEFIQVHPTAIPGEDKLRLISESVRGEGGRVWTYKNGKKWYFLEEMYPKYGNLVPRDIATRVLHKVCVEMGLGVEGKNMVYLDVTHIKRERLEERLGGVMEIYRKFVGDDPCEVPMKVFPGVHYSMGGLWIDYDQATNIPGLYAAGEVDYEYHGANRLGANSLLSCFYGGMVAGPKVVEYVGGLEKSSESLSSSLFDAERQRQQEIMENMLRMDGPENPFALHQELGELMNSNMTIVRTPEKMQETQEKLKEFKERWRKCNPQDKGTHVNMGYYFTRQLWDMLELAEVIIVGAIARKESRGSHYRPDFPKRDDENWLKTTKATWTPDGPQLSYDPVDCSLVVPRERRYDK